MQIKSLLFILLIPTIMSCAPSTKDIASIKNFDSKRFLGKWYEVGRLDHSFERGLDFVTATYSIRDDGKIEVKNEGIKQDGTLSQAFGKAYIKKTNDKSGELRVSFFWIFYAKYRIIYLDENYQTAIVTSGTKNYLWILSRIPVLPENEMSKLISFCKEKGFETEKLIFPKQK